MGRQPDGGDSIPSYRAPELLRGWYLRRSEGFPGRVFGAGLRDSHRGNASGQRPLKTAWTGKVLGCGTRSVSPGKETVLLPGPLPGCLRQFEHFVLPFANLS